MILLKTKEEIELLRASNELVSKTLGIVAKVISPGITTRSLDELAEDFIRDNGGIPGFLGYNGYPATLCTSVNDEVVHGIPSSYALKEGDIISIDCGVILNGYFGDSAYTFAVGEPDPGRKALMENTREALYLGIKKAKTGFRLGDIGHAIQNHAEKAGYSVVREMVGHGLGKNLHEEPEVPNFGRQGSGVKLKPGMVFCIEPMINMGTRFIQQDRDGWTIRTRDGRPSAHYELAVAITEGGPDVLSTFKYIEETLN
jgi:methionyl aminopeptidase